MAQLAEPPLHTFHPAPYSWDPVAEFAVPMDTTPPASPTLPPLNVEGAFFTPQLVAPIAFSIEDTIPLLGEEDEFQRLLNIWCQLEQGEGMGTECDIDDI